MKFWPSATLFLLTGSCLLTASEEARLRNLENRLTALEKSKNCCIINPPARPYSPDCWGVYATIDPLLWQGHVNGLGIAVQSDTSDIFLNDSGQSHVKNLHFNWDWGFRVGLGLNTNHDAWDLLLRWTYWNTTGRKNITAPDAGAFFPNVGSPLTTGFQSPGQIEASWKLIYNVLDLSLGRDFFVSKFLTLRPFIGLKSAWVRQKFDTEYENFFPAAPDHHIDQKNHFWGIGILGGVDTQWCLGGGWSLFGNYAASLLYGQYKVSAFEKESPSIPETFLFNVKNVYHVGTAINDMQIGIRYDWLSCDECFHVGVDFGWEHHFLPGQNQFMDFVGRSAMPAKFVSNQGDLGIQGYFVQARFDF